MSDTTTNTAGAVVWFEIPALDTEPARRLYSELFGVGYERHGAEDYHLSYAAQQHLLVCRHFLQAL